MTASTVQFGAIALADLDNDGNVEILAGRQVADHATARSAVGSTQVSLASSTKTARRQSPLTSTTMAISRSSSA